MTTIGDLMMPERFIQLRPQLAAAIGLGEAVVLQQLASLLAIPTCGKKLNGHKWIYNSYLDWQKEFFPFWSVSLLKKTFISLEEMGLVESCQPEGGASRRKYYRIPEGAMSKVVVTEPKRDRTQVKKRLNSEWTKKVHSKGQKKSIPATDNHAEILTRKAMIAPSSQSSVLKAKPAKSLSLKTPSEPSETEPLAPRVPIETMTRKQLTAYKAKLLENVRYPYLIPREEVDAFQQQECPRSTDLGINLWEKIHFAKFHSWNNNFKRWEPIKDWKAYLLAFEEALTPQPALATNEPKRQSRTGNHPSRPF